MKNRIVRLVKNKFHEIPPIIEVVECVVKIGWLEVHFCDSSDHSLEEFMISSLRHVEFWKYGKEDQIEFENDVLQGTFKSIDHSETTHKFQLLKNMFSSELTNISDELIPKNLRAFDSFKDVILVYDDWNNKCITLVSNSQFKNIFWGHSE